MTMTRLLGAAAVAALIAGSAHAQTPTPTQTPAAPPAAATTPTAPPEESAPTPSAAPATAATPATPATPAAPGAAAGQVVAKGDIVETLKADGHFTTFVKAIDAANMTSVLKTNSNLTVFAPNDAAFAALPAGELDKLMKDPAALQKLLTYHVVNATVDSTKIKGAKGGVKTVAGSELILDGSGATPMANNASIVQVDVKATNGTVHVIDKVLMPGGATTAAAASTGAPSDAAATAPAATPEPAPAPAATPAPGTTPPSATAPAPATPVPAGEDEMTDDAEAGKPAADVPPGEKPKL